MSDQLTEMRAEILRALETVSDRAVAADAEQALSDLLDELEYLQDQIRKGIPDALTRATPGQLIDELIDRGVTLFRFDSRAEKGGDGQ